MPKEIVHWVIADIAKESLGEESQLKKIINRFNSEYLIGAIAFDILYYDFFSHDSKEMAKIASKLHGIGFEFARTNYTQIVDYYGNLPDFVWAFIAGSFCHAFTDICFHPLVYYYTKDSIPEHRAFETKLDLFYIRGTGLKNLGISKILGRISVSKKDFLTFLSLFSFGNASFNKKIASVLLKYRVFQFMIRKKVFYIFMKFINILTGNKFKDIIPLFYFDFKKSYNEPFADLVFYPEGGKLKKVDIKYIEDKTIKLIVEKFKMLEKLIDKQNNLTVRDFFLDFRIPPLAGESLKNEC